MSLKKKDYQHFVTFVRKWRDYLGLYDWDIATEFGGEILDAESRVTYLVEDMAACIMLNDDWDFEPPPEHLDKLALHEVVHLLLAPLRSMVSDRIPIEMVRHTEHRIIMMIVSALMRKR